MTTIPTTEDGERVELHRNGTVSIYWETPEDGLVECTLKRPFFRQLRDIQTKSDDVSKKTVKLMDPVQELGKQARAKAAEIRARQKDEGEEFDEDAARAEVDAIRDEAARLQSEANVGAMDLMHEVWTMILKKLGDTAPPKKDEFPIFLLLDADLVGELIQHWSSVPLVRG